MNAATAVAAPTVQHAPSTESSVGSSRAAARVSAAASARQTLVRAVRSEWIKLRTLRSTWVTAVITLFMTTGIGTLATVISSKPEYFGSNSWKTAIIGTVILVIVLIGAGAFFFLRKSKPEEEQQVLEDAPIDITPNDKN